ncbi:MAG: DUF2950 domain-containing protein, partial [Bauldia sp.]|nr:DUF2950 domain-containing protein [Bauldia sp.]
AHPWDRFVGAEATGYPDPGALVDAFTTALAASDIDTTLTILGLTPDAVTSDNFNEDFEMVQSFAAEKVSLRDLDADRKILLLGRDVWPFPFPIVHNGDSWMFDTVAGLDEIINRRIGENELQAITTERDYVSAQEAYWQTDWDDDGVVEYAQRLISTPGTYDGLYWPSGDGIPASPAGAYIEEAALPDGESDGYFGYRYRVLTGQGDNIAGGAYDYVINGNMIAGFALIAWPVTYGSTGINTFVVNQYGTVYQKDLGDETDRLAGEITLFDPDDTWSVVTEATH